jgi:hypothetical protein
MSRIEGYRFGRVLVDALERSASTLTADSRPLAPHTVYVRPDA